MVPAPRPRRVAPAPWRRLGPLAAAIWLLVDPATGHTAPATHQPRTARCAPTRADPKSKSEASKADPKDSKTGTGKAGAVKADPKAGASKPDPKASKPDTNKADPKASKTDAKKPDPKASKTGADKADPKDSKSDANKADPKASKTDAKKPDPKDSKSDAGKADPKVGKTDAKKPDLKDSKPDAGKADPKASKSGAGQPDPKDSRSGADEPDPKDSKPAAVNSESQASQPAPAPAAPPGAGGYWLGARLLGAGAAAALSDLAQGAAPDPTAPDAGVVAQVQTMPEAMAWVARWAFGDAVLPPPAREPADSPLILGPAPIPGGALYSQRGAALHALTVRGRNPDGSARAIRWPSTAAELIPPGSPWLSAVLLAERAPLFAAPAARVPPASERFTFARRGGSLWLLGHVDRCSLATGERVCLRWAQVLSRDGDEFHAGYLPAAQVALVDGWRRGAGATPRAQLLVSGSVGPRMQLLLVARTRDGGLHRRTVEAPMQGDTYPAARLRVEGEWAIVEVTGAPTQRIALDASLDLRVR